MRTVLIAIAIIGMAALGAVAYRGGIVFAAKPDEAGEPPAKPPVIADTSTASDVVPRHEYGGRTRRQMQVSTHLADEARHPLHLRVG